MVAVERPADEISTRSTRFCLEISVKFEYMKPGSLLYSGGANPARKIVASTIEPGAEFTKLSQAKDQ